MAKFAGFQKVKLVKPQRSEFDLSHQKRLSTRMGRLTPCFITECVPGDKFFVSSEILLRLAPLLAPIYDSIQLFVHFFFVPNRLLWEEWETFITGGRLGAEIDPAMAPVPPFADIGQSIGVFSRLGESSLADYLGVPIVADINPTQSAWNDCHIDVMPFAAYQLVWYEYYRDRNFVSDTLPYPIPMPSGEVNPVGFNLFDLRTRAYMHDYFTSALPFTQRGAEVILPVAGTAAVTYLDQSLVMQTDGVTPAPGDLEAEVGPPAGGLRAGAGVDAQLQNIDEVVLNGVTSTINDFRTAYALQVWLERNAIAGSRYVESIEAQFGVKSPDSRLQRPEYIGGGRIPVRISEVVSTAYSDDGAGTVPLANMAGHGVTYGNTNRASYFCVEHGFIIGIMSIMNPPSYHQGLPRMFRRKTFLDYPWPTFAKLGEQEVKKYELYASPANLTEDSEGEEPLFGYQSRYADWKYMCSTNHGQFHSTLLFWTLTREFANSPTLGASFVAFDDSTQDRIFAVNGEEDNFWCYIHNRVNVRRALPYFGQPNTLGFV